MKNIDLFFIFLSCHFTRDKISTLYENQWGMTAPKIDFINLATLLNYQKIQLLIYLLS